MPKSPMYYNNRLILLALMKLTIQMKHNEKDGLDLKWLYG